MNKWKLISVRAKDHIKGTRVVKRKRATILKIRELEMRLQKGF
jgi:hypothetical protein